MFALPMACLLLMVPGQAGKVDENTDPDTLLRKVDQIVVRGDLREISSLLKDIKKAYEMAKDSDQKIKLQQAWWELNNCESSLTQRKKILDNSIQKRDTRIPLLGAALEQSLHEGKAKFLVRRKELVDLLKDSTSEAQVDQMSRFTLSKVLEDMDRLIQLDQDPVRRAETEKLFALLADENGPEEPYPVALGETPMVRKTVQMQRQACQLLGPTSFIRLRLLHLAFNIMVNECIRGQMPDVDIQSEMEREFAPYLHSEWAKNWSFKVEYCKLSACVCLTPKGKNYEKMAMVIQELEVIKQNYGVPNSNHFIEAISYRLLMLNQQGRHQECILEFEKIKSEQLSQATIRQKINLVDIHQSAAQSYAALGKKEQALVQQELAFWHCLEVPSPKNCLVRFRKSVAKDLRDKYAQNNRMQDARNLEERCQLLGLGFDPLPKQPGE